MLHAALDSSGNVYIHNCFTEPVNLIHLPPSDQEYRLISQKFSSSWKHPGKPHPTIKHIFYVAYSGGPGLEHLTRFSDYSNRVGNTEMLFHGTSRECTIGDNINNVKCCASTTCNLCCILRGSYTMAKAKNRSMFGYGIYSSSVSSKADGYSRNVGANQYIRRPRAMVVNHVAMGKTSMMYKADHDLTHAPITFNSVTAATTTQGGAVLYHEAVVYREDAICANAIVVYD
ncbi:hypothetical protein D9619_008877 [Psilocybe cf. subviscida]|uniref:PARP catalytic domain-containing protein n=1 Tax=Psilocybe cf. subviscida TaxID=2480587 RepID=A0A8H5F115_9AGAR|nr:hypothetical protein D9619_008877 [Psilocybe cf. subviscida]